jgi:hypothetical protein
VTVESCIRKTRGHGICREFVERAGNFMPSIIAMFILTSGQSTPWWFNEAAAATGVAIPEIDSFIAHLITMAAAFVLGVIYCTIQRVACAATKAHAE